MKTTLHDRIKSLLDNNHRTGKTYDYTCPSPGVYPHQWLWDSSFHAITLTHIDPERSKREIRTLLAKQKENGFISCVSIWEKRTPFEEMIYINKITQSPVIPISVETIFEKTKDINFVKESYPKLKKFMNWLAENRDRNNNNLIEIIHPWESDDGNPSFDKQMGFKNPLPTALENYYALFKILTKYSLMGWDEKKIYKSGTFRSETALFNSIYAKSLLSMESLAKALGNKDDAKDFRSRYEKTKEALINLCWNKEDKIFYDLDAKGKQSGVKTVSSLMPLILPDLPVTVAKPLIEKHLLNEKEFWTPVPVPSVALDEPTFNPGKSLILWRGPMWVNTNWFLAKALLKYGYKNEATHLIKKTEEVIDKHGFWEFYDPITGEGYGQKTFGWSTLVLDMLSLV